MKLTLSLANRKILKKLESRIREIEEENEENNRRSNHFYSLVIGNKMKT